MYVSHYEAVHLMKKTLMLYDVWTRDTFVFFNVSFWSRAIDQHTRLYMFFFFKLTKHERLRFIL